jgi:prepilin-type N-terminal cleavage/methylation domain-containing protein
MSHRPRLSRGFTLVELMVCLALGLALVACALLAWAHHLRETQHQVVQAQLMHELRTTTQFMANNIRRAGHHDKADQNMGASAFIIHGPELRVRFSNVHPGTDQVAYRLHQGVIQVQWGHGAWQAMTDEKTLKITQFEVAPQTQTDLVDLVTANCKNRQEVTLINLNLKAQAIKNPEITQALQTTLRVRNDFFLKICSS